MQIEIMHERKRKWVSAGVKIYKDQWSERGSCVVGCNEQVELNERINAIKGQIADWVNALIKERQPFSWQELDAFLAVESGRQETFIDFVRRRIAERTDIAASTRRTHKKIVASLEGFGRIVTFADLTRANIQDYYEYLLSRKVEKTNADGQRILTQTKQSNAWGYMKILRTYIHDAVNRELIPSDPSAGIKVRRGDSEPGRWLTDEELERLWTADMGSWSLTRVRDLIYIHVRDGTVVRRRHALRCGGRARR